VKLLDGGLDDLEMERLSNDRFMPPSAFRLFHHRLHERVEIHWHEFFEMAFVVAGEGVHVLNGTAYPLTRGSLFLLTPADFHAIELAPGGALELFNAIFSEAMIEEDVGRLLFQGLSDHHQLLEADRASAMEAEFRRLEAETQDQRAGHQRVIHSTLQRLLVEIARGAPARPGTNGKPPAQPHRLHKVLTYLHHHYREPVTLRVVAEQAALSPTYFSECFRAATGETYQRYLQSLRLRFAKSLLAASPLPVTDVCFASGFQTLSHFERAFKREFGCSPTAWRAAAGQTDRCGQPELIES
jgi:AraC-like DNA-binding protein